MHPIELEDLGQVYYGDKWVEPMARDLGVNRSTVWRWREGLTPINDEKLKLLKQRLRKRKKPVAPR